MKYKYLFIAMMPTIFLACQKGNLQKDKVINNIQSFQSLYDFTSQKNGGSFFITENTYIGSTKNLLPQEIVVSGAFKDEQTKQIKKGGIINIEGMEIQPDLRGGYSKSFSPTNDDNLFGKKMNLKLDRTESTINSRNDGVLEGQTTSPLPMRCSDTYNTTVYDANKTFINANNLYPGSIVHWNLDQTNTRGVFIYIEYDPDDLTNLPLKNAGYTQREGNAVLLDDIGSATLTRELFADIPLNAKITMYIGRGNFEYLQDRSGNISNVQIYSLSYQYGAYRYQVPN